MNMKIIQRTVRFEKTDMDRLDAIAAGENRSFADLLRSIIKQHLNGGKIENASHLRLARVCEYTQAAVDTILREEHPDHRQLVLDETTRRMERYHGSR
ncbi:hypothetical protein [Novosphingobium sp. BL-52-GroH]|uniref:hypothetical protein n=1 Tax=Novosphingobium sp. BL-52-GroH TaxID=3349877 RepID=UPI00384D3BB3